METRIVFLNFERGKNHLTEGWIRAVKFYVSLEFIGTYNFIAFVHNVRFVLLSTVTYGFNALI